MVAQTVLSSLARYGEKLEAIVSLVAIAVLLLILNWFFHRVYWNDHLASLHGRKKRDPQRRRPLGRRGAARRPRDARLHGRLPRGLRDGPLPAGARARCGRGAASPRAWRSALVGVAAVGVLTIALQRKLPHRRMLELTGLLILCVLVVMVGKTVQVCQVVGWLPVHPIGELRLPYWAGLWFGVFPTWEGVVGPARRGGVRARKLRGGGVAPQRAPAREARHPHAGRASLARLD